MGVADPRVECLADTEHWRIASSRHPTRRTLCAGTPIQTCVFRVGGFPSGERIIIGVVNPKSNLVLHVLKPGMNIESAELSYGH